MKIIPSPAVKITKITMCSLLLLVAATVALSAGLHFVTLNYPLQGVIDTEGTAISASGMIVGRYFSSDVQYGFTYISGKYRTVSIPGSTCGTDAAWGNSFGDISGNYCSGGITHAYVSSQGKIKTIDYPGALVTTGWGINDFGDVIGTEYTETFSPLTDTCFTREHSSPSTFLGRRPRGPRWRRTRSISSAPTTAQTACITASAR